jgi:hypothetical protein
MPKNLNFPTALRNAIADAITTFAGGSCLLRIYSGTQPANANTALSGQTLLAELTCNATFAPSASGGVLTLNAITNDSSANATGTASFFRLLKSDATTVVMDGTVGATGSDLNINSTTITSGIAVGVTGATITIGNT